MAQTSPSPSPAEAHTVTSQPRIPALVQQPGASPPWAELPPSSATALGALPRCPSKAKLQGTSPSTASPSGVAPAAAALSPVPGLPGTASAHQWRVRTWHLGHPSPAVLPRSPQRAPEAVPLPSQLGPRSCLLQLLPHPGGQPSACILQAKLHPSACRGPKLHGLRRYHTLIPGHQRHTRGTEVLQEEGATWAPTHTELPPPARLHGRLFPRRSKRSQGPSHWAAPPTPQSLREKETKSACPQDHVLRP